MTPLFRSKAVYIMERLLKDFPIGDLDAAAIVGNLGLESGGFKYMQEIKPISGRGGLGWPQWTGPRRVAFEAWCKEHGLNTSSDVANYGYLCVELKGSEKSAISAVKAASTLSAKVQAFEQHFERAGVKNYPNRIAYATDALQAWNEASVIPAKPAPPAEPVGPASAGGVAAGGTAVVVAAKAGLPWWQVALIGLVVLAIAGVGIWFAMRKKGN